MDLFNNRVGRFDDDSEGQFDTIRIPAGSTVKTRIRVFGYGEETSREFEFKTPYELSVEQACYVMDELVTALLTYKALLPPPKGLGLDSVDNSTVGVYYLRLGP